jgi:plasmid replication initiation protein
MTRRSRFELQPDLFIANASFVRGKDLNPFMATNWFSMGKTPRTQPILHEHQNYTIKIAQTSIEHGIATVWDHDILIFLFSQLIHAHNRGIQTSQRIRFTGYEYFHFLRRTWSGGLTGQRSYSRLWDSLERLRYTDVQALIKPHGEIESGDIKFFWLPHIERLKVKGKPIGYEVWLDPKVYEWTTNLQNALSLDPRYFDITGGLDRFLYLWARKSVGPIHDRCWTESFELIYEKSGATTPKQQFHQLLRRSIKNNRIPGYLLTELVTPRGPVLEVVCDVNRGDLLKGMTNG